MLKLSEPLISDLSKGGVKTVPPALGCGEDDKGARLGRVLHGDRRRADAPHVSDYCQCCPRPCMPLLPDRGRRRRQAPWWWLPVPALVAVVHCLALVNRGDSDPITARPSLPCCKLSVSNTDFVSRTFLTGQWRVSEGVWAVKPNGSEAEPWLCPVLAVGPEASHTTWLSLGCFVE